MSVDPWIPFLALAVAAAPALAQEATVSEPRADAELPTEVEESIRIRVEQETPALVVGIVDADGPRYRAFGRISEGEPRAPGAHTVFEIGSVTKVFTALLLAEMASRGEVGLDDPLSTLLPDTVRLAGETPITLAHLAGQVSGLPRLPTNLAPADPQNPYADYTEERLWGFLSGYEPPRPPGERYEYSNLGMGLLGHLLARRAGTSYGALVTERIAEPLGLDDTTIELSEEQRERVAPGHSGGEPVPNWDIPVLAGAGALRSTADDMLRFLAHNLGLAESPLVDEMRLTHGARTEVSGEMDVGLAWHIRTAGDSRIVWHNGGTGGYRSFIGFDPEAGRGVVVLANSDIGQDDLGFRILDPDFPLREVRRTVAVPAEVLERWVGSYELAPGFAIDVTRAGEALFIQATGQPRFRAYAASETEFFLRVVPARIEFRTLEDGGVEMDLHQGGNTLTGRKRASGTGDAGEP